MALRKRNRDLPEEELRHLAERFRKEGKRARRDGLEFKAGQLDESAMPHTEVTRRGG